MYSVIKRQIEVFHTKIYDGAADFTLNAIKTFKNTVENAKKLPIFTDKFKKPIEILKFL